MVKNRSLVEEGTDINLQFEKRDGLLPVAVQDSSTGEILMIASVNREAFDHTLETGEPAFWSTSRNELWIKGLTSGNTIRLDDVLVDCDQDALVYRVTLEGEGVCHTKNKNGVHRTSCFYRKLNREGNQLEFKDE
ncbi:phosphoribosyl-AMP cyclohydrolase [Rhodohalobacter mucosus]|uniref:Histidine biosynthesis bifunctional protein HisIE n=1 Tax=Rhodohalobacter mucosus TaxID=2079485 RepID=A0A316TPV1_9BACT|nr:phosphoribosyl-AMP cyclohydrolase [Rhodohalobacter mucosus]PWN06653.1 phosphoribosyl-AMP cyclohydrolase [Rhodohalobacter mucosus]